MREERNRLLCRTEVVRCKVASGGGGGGAAFLWSNGLIQTTKRGNPFGH